MYFDSEKETGQADTSIAKTLFELCLNELGNYVQKQSEILAINDSKEEQKRNDTGSRSGDKSSADVDDDDVDTDGPESEDDHRHKAHQQQP